MRARKLVGWNLRRLRVGAKVPQEALATDAEVDRAYVGRIERGSVNVSVDLLDRLAAALGVHVSAFFVAAKASDPKPMPMPPGRRPKVTTSKKRN